MAASSVTGTGNGSAEKSLPKILNGVVKNENLSADAVSASKINYFKSSEQTGTGSSQNIAHGLGVAPSLVMVYPTDLTPGTDGDYTFTEGSHTSTNVVVTVTNGKKFMVVAFV